MGDSRTAERLVALLHFEMDGRGCGPIENLQYFLEGALDAVLNPDTDEDLTDEQLESIKATCRALAEQAVVALVGTGYASVVEKTIEGLARRRRECEARFGMPRSIPFSREEKESLAKAWNESADGEGDICMPEADESEAVA